MANSSEKTAFVGYERGEEFHYPLENLKKHFIALGSSGSGKTVLAKVLVEEASLNKIPSIVIDNQGDLSTLILNTDEKTVEEKGLSVETFKKFQENTKVVIFTPVSSKGIPICINPLKFQKANVDEEEVIPILQQIANAIAKLLGYETLNDKGKAAEAVLYSVLKFNYDQKKDINNFKNLADAIKTLQGKLKAEVEHFIKDEGDLDVLVRKIKYLTVGEKELMFNFGVPVDIDLLLGKKGINNKDGKTQVSVIYLNTIANNEQKEFFLSILSAKLYQWMLNNPKDRLQCLYLIDEIAPFIPAGSEKPMPKPILKLLFKQARKYGIGCIISTQNPGDIDYKAFAQFGTWAIGRLTTKQDRKKVEESLRSLSPIDISSELPKLKPGNFLLFSPDVRDTLVNLDVRWLYTHHKTLNDVEIKKLIPQEMRDYYKKFETKKISENVTDNREDTGIDKIEIEKLETGVKHIPLACSETEINQIVHRHKKRHFLIGPAKEDVGSIKLLLSPVYRAKVRVVKGKILSMKKDFMEHNMLIDARTGGIIRYKFNYFKRYNEFKKILDLTENQIVILRELSKRRKPTTSAEIALKIKMSASITTKIMNELLKQKTVSYIKQGKEKLWQAIIKVSSTDLKFFDSDEMEYTIEGISAGLMKPLIKEENLETAIRGWFLNSEIIELELVYLPVYNVSFISKKGTRTIKIDGLTSKVI